jgi:hypothetical protein
MIEHADSRKRLEEEKFFAEGENMKTLAKLQMVQEMLDRVKNEQASISQSRIGNSKTSFGESKILD